MSTGWALPALLLLGPQLAASIPAPSVYTTSVHTTSVDINNLNDLVSKVNGLRALNGDICIKWATVGTPAQCQKFCGENNVTMPELMRVNRLSEASCAPLQGKTLCVKVEITPPSRTQPKKPCVPSNKPSVDAASKKRIDENAVLKKKVPTKNDVFIHGQSSSETTNSLKSETAPVLKVGPKPVQDNVAPKTIGDKINTQAQSETQPKVSVDAPVPRPVEKNSGSIAESHAHSSAGLKVPEPQAPALHTNQVIHKHYENFQSHSESHKAESHKAESHKVTINNGVVTETKTGEKCDNGVCTQI